MTLAYVFWHWPEEGVGVAEYEGAQRAFHEALAAVPPPGFSRSLSWGLVRAPWANASGEAYEDWYLVDGFASLETLNEGAVTASRRLPHDAAAALAAGGAGGVYRLRLGEVVPEPTAAHWLSKPAGMPYDELWRRLEPVAEGGGVAIWIRQMVLGPATELCLHAAREPVLPPELAARRVALRRVWP